MKSALILILAASTVRAVGLLGEGFEGRRQRILASDHSSPAVIAAHQSITSNYLQSVSGQEQIKAIVTEAVWDAPVDLVRNHWGEGGLGAILIALLSRWGYVNRKARAEPRRIVL